MASFRSVFSCAKTLTKLSGTLNSNVEHKLMQRSLGLAGRRGLSQLLTSSTVRSAPYGFLRATVIPQSLTNSMSSQMQSMQTKSDVEMAEFLKQEIQTEKESIKDTGKAVQISGFEVQTDDADITLKKTFQDEEIVVRLNVNHSVEQEESYASENEADNTTEMVCKPEFQVSIAKRGLTLMFNCSFRQANDEEEPQASDAENVQDMFTIEEFSISKGEMKPNTYLMAGEVMDGDFYDHLMNMLDARGINTSFAQQVTDFCTLYEQKLYVNLLENMQSIVGKAK